MRFAIISIAMSKILIMTTLCMLYMLGTYYYLDIYSDKVEMVEQELSDGVNIMALFREKGDSLTGIG